MSDNPRLPPHYDIRIDELVLDGFPSTDRHAIVAALERELGRLAADPATPLGLALRGGGLSGLALRTLDAGRISLAPSASPRAAGEAAARAIGLSLRALPSSIARSGGRRP